jgi:hypothetical protein
MRRKDRIDRLVIGTHFHQTHPDVITRLHRNTKVRFVKEMSGVFHHKIYLFENSKNDWAVVVGSANFTRSAFERNDESAVLIDALDVGAGQAKIAIDRCLASAWEKGEQTLTSEWIRWYKSRYKQKQERLRNIANRFSAEPKDKGKQGQDKEEGDDGGRSVGEVPLLTMNWVSFLRNVADEARRTKKQGLGDLVISRLRVLDRVRDIFKTYDSFSNIPYEDRCRVCGLKREEDGIDWLWFGSMLGAGYFKKAVKIHSGILAAAIDSIPLTGAIEKSDYKYFLAAYRKVSGCGLGTATRLLCMKRPDVFLPINDANARLLKNIFGLKHKIDFDNYWDSVVMRVQESTWWNAPRPVSQTHRKIWDGRAAMLDAVSYEPDRR